MDDDKPFGSNPNSAPKPTLFGVDASANSMVKTTVLPGAYRPRVTVAPLDYQRVYNFSLPSTEYGAVLSTYHHEDDLLYEYKEYKLNYLL